jgi:D-alanyl-D-alanine carboxypeptidase/D-alanyl-D-alanine-endopeptidase (penicillin-binding protein 4)
MPVRSSRYNGRVPRFRTLAASLVAWLMAAGGLLPGVAGASPKPSVAPLIDPGSGPGSRSGPGMGAESIGARAARAARLRQQIDGILKSPALRKARVGIEVLEASSGAELLNHNADSPFNPASNTKILTTAAAMSKLGTDYRYRTVLLAGAAPSDKAAGEARPGVLRGDLFVQGSGDPSLTAEGLAELALRLHRAGVERVEGEVRIDNQLRDLAQLTSQADATAYGPGALILGGDRYTVHVSPGEVGHGATVWVGPRLPYFVVHNQVRTVRGKRSRIVVDHEQRDDHLIVTVRGRIGVKGRSARVRKRLYDTSAWATATLQQAFSDFGITVQGGVKVGPPPRGPLTVVAEHKSEPLSRICRVINKDSNNFVADTLFKTLGAARFGLPGTLEKGARAVAEWLSPLGLDPARVHLVNGSGLTHANRLRPADLGQLLYKLYHSLDLGPEFLQSLAVGGIDGTISHRFHGALAGLVRGKTGTLSGVSVLSGYVGDRPGVMIFCIFVEGFHGRRLAAIRQAQGRIVEAIMRFVHDGQGPHDSYRPPTSLGPSREAAPPSGPGPKGVKPPPDSTPASDTVEDSEDDEA